ncbi:hypothetical protein OJF2_70080 [Aquisphaera giovannonii]|uniref:Uncharacterized protein n=1 Tax=Aquisphaera giovannonii TaxID=406548 RepID=A0A5B9WD15_9BACT|nr:hypothetical protein [Aquisphaera giovannonii]QEH38407.1 hypothetical protein OJF2_70080 [Aquisphaera giovannonii]
MAGGIAHSLATTLLLWALGWLGASVIGLYARAGELWRSFWFMSGLWGLIDGLIAWYVLVGGPRAPAELLPVLRLNAGLDILYVAAGAALLGRGTPLLRGFGLAVLVQGAFLLALDGTFWRLCTRAAE